MMSTRPAVSCIACARTWNSASMAEGLRLVGVCPRCGGALEFADAGADAPAVSGTAQADSEHGLAPHLVLGIPRR